MRIRSINHIILLFSFIIVALFNSHSVRAESFVAASGKAALNRSSSRSSQGEMELIKQDVSSVCHPTIQKKIFTLAAIPAGTNEHGAVADERLFIKNSLLLVKSHLRFNYPFHHFW